MNSDPIHQIVQNPIHNTPITIEITVLDGHYQAIGTAVTFVYFSDSVITQGETSLLLHKKVNSVVIVVMLDVDMA